MKLNPRVVALLPAVSIKAGFQDNPLNRGGDHVLANNLQHQRRIAQGLHENRGYRPFKADVQDKELGQLGDALSTGANGRQALGLDRKEVRRSVKIASLTPGGQERGHRSRGWPMITRECFLIAVGPMFR